MGPSPQGPGARALAAGGSPRTPSPGHWLRETPAESGLTRPGPWLCSPRGFPSPNLPSTKPPGPTPRCLPAHSPSSWGPLGSLAVAGGRGVVALVVDGGPSVQGERVRRGQEPRAWRDVELRVCEHGDRVETLPGHRHPERHQVGRCRRGKDSVRGQDHGPGLRRGVLATHGVARPSKGLVRQATPGPSVPSRPACPHSRGTSVRRGGCWRRGQLQQRDPQGPDLLQAPRPCLFCSLPGCLAWDRTGAQATGPLPGALAGHG